MKIKLKQVADSEAACMAILHKKRMAHGFVMLVESLCVCGLCGHCSCHPSAYTVFDD